MPAVNLTNAAALGALQGYMKEDYTIHGLTDQVNREAEFFGRIRRSAKELRGKYGIIPVILKGNRNAVGARNELDDLPSPAFQQTATSTAAPPTFTGVQGQIHMAFNTARFAITEAAIQASATSEGAFESGLEVEMKGLTMDMGNDLNRQHITGKGRAFGNTQGSGRLCRVAGGTTTIPTVDDPGGITCWPDADDNDGAKYLESGDVVAVYSAAGAYRATIDIKSIDRTLTPNAVTFSAAVGAMVAGDYLVKGSATGVTTAIDDAADAETFGLAGWVDDAVGIVNIDTTLSGNERWASSVIDHTAAPVMLQEALLHQITTLIRRRGGRAASENMAHWTTYALENDYGTRILTPEKRYPNTTVLAGGYTALTFNGRPILVDKDMLPGHWYTLTMSELYCYNQGGFYWMDRDAMFSRVPDKMGWEATLLFYSNFGSPRRNVHGVIKGLQEPYRVDQWAQ